LIKYLLALITIIILVIPGCSVVVTSLPSRATSVQTLEQKKLAVTEYLRSFKKIDNDFNRAIKSIEFPGISASAEGFQNLNNAFGQAQDVLQVTLRRLDGITLADIDEVKNHFTEYKKAVQDNARIIQSIQKSASDKNMDGVLLGLNELRGLDARFSSVYKQTGDLMLKYTVTGIERQIPILR